MVLNTGPLDLESSALTTGPLLLGHFHFVCSLKCLIQYFHYAVTIYISTLLYFVYRHSQLDVSLWLIFSYIFYHSFWKYLAQKHIHLNVLFNIFSMQ